MIHVLVADSRLLRVFEARPPECRLEEIADFRNYATGRHERDLSSDRPGRVIGGTSGIHHSYEPAVRASVYSKQRWLKSLCEPLRELLTDHRADQLMLVAAPRTLSALRASLPVELRKRVVLELPRDLSGHARGALIKRLQPTLRSIARSASGVNAIYRPATPAANGRSAI